MTLRPLLFLAVLALGGCAASRADTGDDDAAELAATLAGRTAGPTAQCIDANRSSGPQIVGDNLIYRDGRRLWVSQAVGPCPSLHSDPLVVVELHGSQLCANDQFRTVERGGIGIPGPYCRFGPFTPYVQSK